MERVVVAHGVVGPSHAPCVRRIASTAERRERFEKHQGRSGERQEPPGSRRGCQGASRRRARCRRRIACNVPSSHAACLRRTLSSLGDQARLRTRPMDRQDVLWTLMTRQGALKNSQNRQTSRPASVPVGVRRGRLLGGFSGGLISARIADHVGRKNVHFQAETDRFSKIAPAWSPVHAERKTGHFEAPTAPF